MTRLPVTEVTYFLKIEEHNVLFSNWGFPVQEEHANEWSLDFQISKLPENQTACSLCKQVTLFWREIMKLIDSDKRD